jgi:hypothetical protein
VVVVFDVLVSVGELTVLVLELSIVSVSCVTEVITWVEKVGIRAVCVYVIVVEAVWVEILMIVSVERDTEVTVEEVTPRVDCPPCNTPCSGLTIAMAKMRETITETAMREANTSSSLSWRFKRDVSARGQDALYSVMYWFVCDPVKLS